jgi:hypothetical protein
MNITDRHIRELNAHFEKCGAICRIQPHTIFNGYYSDIISCEVVPSSISYILADTKLILDEIGKQFVTDYFNKHNISITWNNMGAIFYEVDGSRV